MRTESRFKVPGRVFMAPSHPQSKTCGEGGRLLFSLEARIVAPKYASRHICTAGAASTLRFEKKSDLGRGRRMRG